MQAIAYRWGLSLDLGEEGGGEEGVVPWVGSGLHYYYILCAILERNLQTKRAGADQSLVLLNPVTATSHGVSPVDSREFSVVDGVIRSVVYEKEGSRIRGVRIE